MGMSKKHFIALAETMKEVKTLISIDGFKEVEREIADFCERQNTRFKRDRWIDYINGKCGKNGGKVK